MKCNLLAEVMVDEGCFQREVARRVDGVTIISRGLHRRLVDGEQVKFRVVTLVEEQLVTFRIQHSKSIKDISIFGNHQYIYRKDLVFVVRFCDGFLIK